jgi:hypothetical protein
VRTGDNEPRRNAPFSCCSSLNPCFSVLLVLLICLLYIFHSLFILILSLHITIFTFVPIILFIPMFSNCQFQFSSYPLQYFLLGYRYSLLHGFLSLTSTIYLSSLIFSASSCLLLSCFIVCFESLIFVRVSHPPIPYSHVRITCLVLATSLIFHYSFTIFSFFRIFFHMDNSSSLLSVWYICYYFLPSLSVCTYISLSLYSSSFILSSAASCSTSAPLVYYRKQKSLKHSMTRSQSVISQPSIQKSPFL